MIQILIFVSNPLQESRIGLGYVCCQLRHLIEAIKHSTSFLLWWSNVSLEWKCEDKITVASGQVKSSRYWKLSLGSPKVSCVITQSSVIVPYLFDEDVTWHSYVEICKNFSPKINPRLYKFLSSACIVIFHRYMRISLILKSMYVIHARELYISHDMTFNRYHKRSSSTNFVSNIERIRVRISLKSEVE